MDAGKILSVVKRNKIFHTINNLNKKNVHNSD